MGQVLLAGILRFGSVSAMRNVGQEVGTIHPILIGEQQDASFVLNGTDINLLTILEFSLMKKLAMVLVLAFALVFVLAFFNGCSEAPSRERVFCLGSNWEIPPAFNGNPWSPGGQTGLSWFAYDSLFFYVPLTAEYFPKLASSVEFLENGEKMRLHLRTGVVWQDGAAFSAKDVETTFLIMWLHGQMWKMSEVRVIDDASLEVSFWAPLSASEKVQILTYPMNSPDHLVDVVASPSRNPFAAAAERARPLVTTAAGLFSLNRQLTPDEMVAANHLEGIKKSIREELYAFRPPMPLGTGPFAFKLVTSSEAVLTKFSKYWNHENVRIDQVKVIRWPSNEVMWAALIAGEIDIAHPATPYDVTEQILKLNPKMKLVTVTDLKEFGFIFNLRKKPTSDIAFRKAVAYILDKDEIRKTAYFYAQTVADSNPGIIQSLKEKWLDRAFQERNFTRFSKNVGKAVQILQDAGYVKDQEGFFQCPGGEELSIEILTQAGATDWILGGEVAANQLRAAGIRATVMIKEAPVANSMLTTSNFSMAGWFGSDMSMFVHPSTVYERIYGSSGFVKKVSGLPNLLKSFDGIEYQTASMAEKIVRDPDLNVENKKIIEHLAWMTNEYLPFVSVYEKRLMIFLQDGKRVRG